MLRNILIIGANGLVIFSQNYGSAVSQPRLVGSLIRTMVEFANRSTGMALSFIELSHGMNLPLGLSDKSPVDSCCHNCRQRDEDRVLRRVS